MKSHGTLKKWNDERGFGFIETPNGDKEIFVHISAFPRNGIRPRIGEMVSFEVSSGPDGKTRAVAIQRPGNSAAVRRPRRAADFAKSRSIPALRMVIILGLLAYAGYRHYISPQSFTLDQLEFGATDMANHENFKCDGRQHCSEMTSRAEAEFFIRNCPDVKMDGDNDGVPCENDSRY